MEQINLGVLETRHSGHRRSMGGKAQTLLNVKPTQEAG